jgi:diguanylate cyclase (GGDEF)-like protein
VPSQIEQKKKRYLEERDILRRILFGYESPAVIYEEFALLPEETFIKLSDLQKEIEKLRELVYKDELTQVLNRRGFLERFESLFKEGLYYKENRDESLPKRKLQVKDFSLLFVDGDNFKEINDDYGHDKGDKVLQGMAEVMSSSIRGLDSVSRFGGEEFVVCLLGASEEEAYKKAEEIRTHITGKVKIKSNPEHKITVSIGVASLNSSDADELDELIGYADKAMYEAKSNRGKDNTVRWSEIAEFQS